MSKKLKSKKVSKVAVSKSFNWSSLATLAGWVDLGKTAWAVVKNQISNIKKFAVEQPVIFGIVAFVAIFHIVRIFKIGSR